MHIVVRMKSTENNLKSTVLIFLRLNTKSILLPYNMRSTIQPRNLKQKKSYINMVVGKKDMIKLERVLSFLQKIFTMKDKLLMDKPKVTEK
jgi:hypothetical protein